MKICIIAGTRPNFIKIAPLIHAIDTLNLRVEDRIEYDVVHTGQHYDKNMSKTFFEELNIPEPDINLNVGSGSQAEQTAAIMIGFENYLLANPCDIVIVVGDVNSTMACAVTAKKLQTKVAHIEAGIRSFDISMPEEINRMITDSITDYYFTPSESANINLNNEGVKQNIYFVGNIMIDSLLKQRKNFRKPNIWNKLRLSEKKYLVLTLHRPNNVDNKFKLNEILNEIISNSRGLPIIFPVHPRTLKRVKELKLNSNKLNMVSPMTYLEFNYLIENSKAVITDSGGITEETTIMEIPCMTLRDNTERPETVTIGTNELIGSNHTKIKQYLNILFSNEWKKGETPDLWDGHTSERIIKIIDDLNI